MMLTIAQPTTYGYKSVHDLPTPPSAFRPSPPPPPPLGYQEPAHWQRPNPQRTPSPVARTMSNPHRGLPPPAAMTMPPQQHPPPPPPQQQQQHQQPPPPPQTHHHHPPPPHPSSQHPLQHHQHPHHAPPPPPPPPQPPQNPAGHEWSALPAPPPQWQGSEESMRNWLQTRAEEERTRQEEERSKQEEEKTRQEGLRLEQRKIEADMLRASLSGGIPPAMVPLVFAGMGAGGGVPQSALEWAQQFTPHGQGHQQLQLMGGQQGPMSPHHQREHSGQTSVQYVPAPSPYPAGLGSPSRGRAQTITGGPGQPMAPGPGVPGAMAAAGSNPGAVHATHGQMHGQPAAQQETSPSIYFHHWQPPSSQAGGSSSNRPGSPSAVPGTGETSRKRKGTASSDQRPRSPPSQPFPFFQSSSSSSSNHPSGGRSHKRQRSEFTWPTTSSAAAAAHEEMTNPSPTERSPVVPRERARSETGRQSVSALLASDPEDRRPQQTGENPSPHGQPSTEYHRGGGGDDRGGSR